MIKSTTDYIMKNYDWIDSFYMNNPQGVMIMLPDNIMSDSTLEYKLKQYIWLV